MHFSILLCALLFAAVACTRTVQGGFVDSPDKKYRMYGKIVGAYGHSLYDTTKKTVRIHIVENNQKEKELFKTNYQFVGSHIHWDAKWDKNNVLNLIISESVNQSSNLLKEIKLYYNSASGRFEIIN